MERLSRWRRRAVCAPWRSIRRSAPARSHSPWRGSPRRRRSGCISGCRAGRPLLRRMGLRPQALQMEHRAQADEEALGLGEALGGLRPPPEQARRSRDERRALALDLRALIALGERASPLRGLERAHRLALPKPAQRADPLHLRDAGLIPRLPRHPFGAVERFRSEEYTSELQ